MLDEKFSIVMSLFCLSASLFVLLWKFMPQINGLPPICPPTPVDQLRDMLGAAYNTRYMSIDKPADLFTFTPEFTDVHRRQNSTSTSSDVWKRLSSDDGGRQTITGSDNFHVAPTFRRLLQEEGNYKELIKRLPGAKVKRQLRQQRVVRLRRDVTLRAKRQTSAASASKLLPWQCLQHIEWLDLGQDHFPRYMRSVKCSADRCFYGHYQCKPKAFTVKVLRRISDKCVELTPELREKLNLPVFSAFDEHFLDSVNDQPKFFEPWAFEEIAVNFCCDCVL